MFDSAVAQTKAARDSGRALHQKVKDALTAELAKPEPDLAAVAAVADGVQQQGIALRHQVRDAWLQLYATFSPEQKAVVRDLMQQHMARMGSFRQKMKDRMSGGELSRRRDSSPLSAPARRRLSGPSAADPQADIWTRPSCRVFFVGRAKRNGPSSLFRYASTIRGPQAARGLSATSASAAARSATATTGFASRVIPAPRVSSRAASVVSPETISAGGRLAERAAQVFDRGDT